MNYNEQIMLDRMEDDEEKKEAIGPEIKIGEKPKKNESRWKNKFIHIWKLSE